MTKIYNLSVKALDEVVKHHNSHTSKNTPQPEPTPENLSDAPEQIVVSGDIGTGVNDIEQTINH